MQILWHFPHTTTKSFKENMKEYSGIIMKNGSKNGAKGKTGYPFVDAGMRELNTTGHMHNRVRK